MWQSVAWPPDRMTLTNLESGDEISAQFNPDEAREVLAVNFAELDVLGMSHKPMQYQNTSNFEVSFELSFDGMSARSIPGAKAPDVPDSTMYARRFLHHLCYSRKESDDVLGGGPPRVFLYWPHLYAFTARIVKLEGTLKRFSNQLQPTAFTYKVTVKEGRELRIYSEDVLEIGTGDAGPGRNG